MRAKKGLKFVRVVICKSCILQFSQFRPYLALLFGYHCIAWSFEMILWPRTLTKLKRFVNRDII